MQKIVVYLYKIVFHHNSMKFFRTIDPENPGSWIASTLASIEARYSIWLTIHDCHGLLFYRNGSPYLPDRGMHRNPFCMTGRFLENGWNRRCHEECAWNAETTAQRAMRPFLHHCWKGVTELVVPIDRNGSLLLLLYAGTFRPPDGNAPDCLTEELKAMYAALPPENEELFAELSSVLQIFGQGIRHYLDRKPNCGDIHSDRRRKICRYIEDHAHEPVRLADLARSLHLSPVHCCHQVRYHFGVSFQQLLLKERMIRACNLLETTPLPQKTIAAMVGCRNEFYFNRLFSREFGISPGEYRKQKIKERSPQNVASIPFSDSRA